MTATVKQVALTRVTSSMLAAHHQYELGWVLALFLLVVCTACYGLAFRGAVAKTDGHREPLEQVSTGEEEGAGRNQVYQRGYVNSPIGRVLYVAWVSLPALGYIQLAWFTMDQYLVTLHAPDLTWIQLAEPFLLIFAVSHLAFFLASQYLAQAKVFFMTPSSLGSATKVLIEDPKDVSANVLAEVCIEPAMKLRYFEFTCVRYLWVDADHRFQPVGDHAVTASAAAQRVKAGGLTVNERRVEAMAGPNVIDVHVPGVLGSLANEFLDAIYCFQFSCIWMYMFYTTWNIAFIWLTMVMASGLVKALLIVRRNRLKIRELARTEVQVTVQRDGQWTLMGSREVVPGDVVLIAEGTVSCDVAVVDGGVVVNESMLTGEPMPVQRFQVEVPGDVRLDPTTHKKNFLFAGTIVMQSAGPVEGRAVGVVVATGARTAKGSLVRMVLFPAPVSFKFTDQLRQVYAIMFLYVCALFCVALTSDQGHWILSVFCGLCILAQALNPNLPVSLAIAQTVSAHRLDRELGVKCLAPHRIPIAGKVHVMVMDKTGTITKDGMDFAGVHPVRGDGAAFGAFVAASADGKAVDMSGAREEVGWVLAGCHTVTKLRDGSLVGNVVECAMLGASGWRLSEDSRSATCEASDERLEILKRLDFDHHRMTSGAVVRVRDRTLALVKGSYEAVEALAVKESVPPDYKLMTERYAKERYYVLGVGARELEPGSEALWDRDSLESGLHLLGLLLFRNEVKPDSPDVIAHLKEGGVRGVMCTGDNALTGAAIGERCGLMGGSLSKVILGEKGDAPGSIRWLGLPESQEIPHEAVLTSREEDVDLVVTRDAFKVLIGTGDLDRLLKHIRVYARMQPNDKVTVIQKHQACGWIVGMCGDGGNDCGGLRAAHVGVALSEAEASIVAPFSSGSEYGTGSKSMLAVVHLLRYGRATLCANIATYSYFMVYGLTLPPAKLTMVFMGNTMLPEWHFLFIDIVLGAFMVATMTLGWPSERLAGLRPSAALFGFRTVFSVLMHVAIFFAFFGASIWLLKASDFYITYDPVKDLDLPGHEWAKKGDNYHCAVTFLCLACQLATAGYAYSFGAEHRRDVWRNVWLTLVYCIVLLTLFTLLLGGPSEFHCMFRVNCDQATSRSMYIPVLQELSTGNLGGCFLGPQYKAWRAELGLGWRFPNVATNLCWPSPSLDPEERLRIPSGALLWGSAQCLGANNCFPEYFRKTMACLLAAQVLVSLVAQKLMLMWHPAQRHHFKKL